MVLDDTVLLLSGLYILFSILFDIIVDVFIQTVLFSVFYCEESRDLWLLGD